VRGSAPDPEAAVNDADRVHMALADDAVVDGLLARIEPRLGKDTIVVDHTTTAPVATGVRVTRMNGDGHPFLHAPVFMSPQMCRDATGLMLVAGPGEVYERALPSLRAMTGDVWYVGGRPELAAAYKIFGNSLMFAIAGGLADIMSMAANLGVAPQDAAALFTRFKPAASSQREPRRWPKAISRPLRADDGAEGHAVDAGGGGRFAADGSAVRGEANGRSDCGRTRARRHRRARRCRRQCVIAYRTKLTPRA
jgi:3-hydroxyisobutyrate dehydrogenase-like beta-hydroxyacid dehydrogenase